MLRRAQQSNVFIIQTTDIRRFYEAVVLDFTPIDKEKKRTVMVFKPYIQSLAEVSMSDKGYKENDVAIDPLGLYQQLTNQMCRPDPTSLIIEGIIVPAHAEMIRDWLLSWDHHPMLFKNQSTIMVFTASTSFFPDTLRRMVVEIEPPISLPSERELLLKKVRDDMVKGAQAKNLETVLANQEYFNQKLPSLVLASSGLTLHEVEVATRISFIETKDLKVEVFSDMRTKILSSVGLTLEQPRRPRE